MFYSQTPKHGTRYATAFGVIKRLLFSSFIIKKRCHQYPQSLDMHTCKMKGWDIGSNDWWMCKKKKKKWLIHNDWTYFTQICPIKFIPIHYMYILIVLWQHQQSFTHKVKCSVCVCKKVSRHNQELTSSPVTTFTRVIYVK